tara:strand:+ start:222 stop:794 length:573 start_codon:yes stop_codon:yes gene_type:complete
MINTIKDNLFATHGKHSPKYALLHWYNDAEPFGDKVETLKKLGLGYNAMLDSDGLWHLTDGIVYHAGRATGMVDANSNTYGLAIPYMGPSQRPRFVEDEAEAIFWDRTKKCFIRYFYTPIPEAMLKEAAELARTIFIKNGWQRVSIYAHHMIDPSKNDIRNLGINTVSHAELSAIFLREKADNEAEDQKP